MATEMSKTKGFRVHKFIVHFMQSRKCVISNNVASTVGTSLKRSKILALWGFY
jgi:hypothetical protein